MHRWVDSEISATILALIIIVVVSLAFVHHMTLKSNQRLKKISKLGIDNRFFVERKELEAYYKSMLVTNSICVICQNPTTRRCSRCKLTKYCSSKCQVIHWKEGHKSKCHAPQANNFGHIINTSEIMCHGKYLETSKDENLATLLNSTSLRFLKNDCEKFINKNNNNRLLQIQTSKGSYNSLAINENLSKPKILLFPYNYFITLFEWNELSVPCGLINCGNSCFANVVLQCLTYTRPLTAYLLNGCHSKDCKRNDWCFICELQSHVHKVRHNQSPFSPIQILSRIRNIGNHLGYGRQEDAHEFMRFAIDSMQSICLDEVGGEKVIDHVTQETTLIHHIFGGHLQSQVKCMQCEHKSNRYESMMDLAVEIHGAVESLEDAISQFTTTEMLDGDNKYKCDHCNAYVKAQKQLTLHEAPNILTIALKRFQSGKFGKLNKRVTFPESLNISPYMSGKNNGHLFYKLYAVVVHVDMLNASFFGHYICYVKDSNGIWYKIDDNKVKEVELEKVLAQRAYMLFYSRLEARLASTIEEKPSKVLAISQLASKNDCIPFHMEDQRNLNFPPTFGTIPVLVDLSKDYINNNELVYKETSDFYKECLDNDDQNGSPLADINYINFHSNVQDIRENSSTCIWIDGTNDLCSSKLQSVANDCFTICNSSCTLVEIEQSNLNESYLWNVGQIGKNKLQHFEDANERLKLTNTYLSGDFDNMDIDAEKSSNNNNVLQSQQLFNVPFDDKISLPLDLSNACEKKCKKIFPQSSTVLLEVESFCSQKTTSVEMSNLDNSLRIYKDEAQSIEEVESLRDSFLIQGPYYQDHALKEELSTLLTNVKKDPLVKKITKIGIEIHEESYNIKPLEDDIPYVVVEPLHVESFPSQFNKYTISQQNMAQQNISQQSMEMFTIEMQDTTIEHVNGATLDDATTTNEIFAIKEQNKINTSIVHIKNKEQVLKPLFFPGFLIKYPRPTLEKSSSILNNDVISSERNIQDHFDEANEGLSNDIPNKSLISNSKESKDKNLNVNGKLDNYMIDNGNHTNEQFDFKKNSNNLPIDFGKKNDVSIFIDQSKNIKNIKQGRNDSCACGSQQKWKKCCGKAIVFKGGLATKQVKV